MLHCNNCQKPSNSKDLMLLKCHVTVARKRLCDSPESWFNPATGLGCRGQIRKPGQKAGKKIRRQKQSRVRVFFFRHVLSSVILSAALAAAAPAHAASVEAEIEQQVAELSQKVTGLTKEVVSFFGFGGDQANNPTDPLPPRQLTARAIEPTPVARVAAAAPEVPAVVRDKPRVDHSLKKLFCVEYARMRSGLAVFGDAKHWWERARNLYARAAHPAEDAVMVFSGSKRLKRGHVAVVTEIVSPREIIVDHANWQNKREVDLATPVMDVSPNNDWSQVRVWDIPSGTFGARTYAVSGFITKGLVRQALNN
jgi:hypothetical protein